ncbi:MAG: hypothetical protein K2K17_06300 [Lachnospiraceae bacterium]|nr:hypothetical protein [Lachnospiraceae bacterium]
MENKDILSKNYNNNSNQVMAETSLLMEEAAVIVAEIASLTESVPSQIKSNALLDACTSAQAEIKKYEIP